MTRVFRLFCSLVLFAALSNEGSADEITFLKCKYNKIIVLLRGKAFLHEDLIDESLRVRLTNIGKSKMKAHITISGKQLCTELMGIADDSNIHAWCDKIEDGVKGTHSVVIDRVTSTIEKQLSIDDSPVIMYEGTCSVKKNYLKANFSLSGAKRTQLETSTPGFFDFDQRLAELD